MTLLQLKAQPQQSGDKVVEEPAAVSLRKDKNSKIKSQSEDGGKKSKLKESSKLENKLFDSKTRHPKLNQHTVN